VLLGQGEEEGPVLRIFPQLGKNPVREFLQAFQRKRLSRHHYVINDYYARKGCKLIVILVFRVIA
jgi:hypothetical protein